MTVMLHRSHWQPYAHGFACMNFWFYIQARCGNGYENSMEVVVMETLTLFKHLSLTRPQLTLSKVIIIIISLSKQVYSKLKQI